MVKFRGWGFNFPTFLVAFLVALLLSGVLTVFNPVVVPPSSGQAAASSCSYAKYKTVTETHGSFNWGTTMRYTVGWNNCTVWLSGHVYCSWWGFGVGITSHYCGAWSPYPDNHYLYIEYSYTTCAVASWFPMCTSEYSLDLASAWGSTTNLHKGIDWQ